MQDIHRTFTTAAAVMSETTQPRLDTVSCLHAGGLHRMAYWEWGEADNPDVVVCVHGLSRQGRDFDRLARALSSRFRVVCPDVAGRGRSDWLPPEHYQIPQYVADMVSLLARLRARRVGWVGTSMGGLIGIALGGLQDSPLHALVLNDVGPTIAEQGLKRLAGSLGQRMRFDDLDQAADYIWSVSQGFGSHSREDWLELCRPLLEPDAQGGLRLRFDPAIMQGFAAIAGPDAAQLVAAGEQAMWALYDQVRAPTLLLRGAGSDILSPGTAQAMRARGPRAACIEWSDVGHAPTLVSAQQIEPVREFLLRHLDAP